MSLSLLPFVLSSLAASRGGCNGSTAYSGAPGYRISDMMKDRGNRRAANGAPYHIQKWPTSYASRFVQHYSHRSALWKTLFNSTCARICHRNRKYEQAGAIGWCSCFVPGGAALADMIRAEPPLPRLAKVAAVHLRIGDVIDYSPCSIDEMLNSVTWFQKMCGASDWLRKGCLHISPRAYVVPLPAYAAVREALQRMGATRVVIVAASSRDVSNYVDPAMEKSCAYVRAVTHYFAEAFGEAAVTQRLGSFPDDDIRFFASAEFFVPSGGGFGALIADMVTRLGRGKVVRPSMLADNALLTRLPVRRGGCGVADFSPGAPDPPGAATILNLRGCYGLLDKDEHEQFSVHAWLLKAAIASFSLPFTFVNASFTYRSKRRYTCYRQLLEYADADPNATFVAVSYSTATFIPDHAARNHLKGSASPRPLLRVRSPKRNPSPPGLRNIKWVVMEPCKILYDPKKQTSRRREGTVQMPYVVDKHGWPNAPRRIPWQQRSLLLFAGRIPKFLRKPGSVRRLLMAQFRGDPRVTSNAQYVDPAQAPPGNLSRRWTLEEYVQIAYAHRFCVVSPGDTPSTHKLAETMVLAAEGGCLPLLIQGIFLPYSDVLNYSSVGVRAPIPRTREATDLLLERLGSMDRHEAHARREAARGMRHAFLMPEAARFALRQFGLSVRARRSGTFSHIAS